MSEFNKGILKDNTDHQNSLSRKQKSAVLASFIVSLMSWPAAAIFGVLFLGFGIWIIPSLMSIPLFNADDARMLGLEFNPVTTVFVFVASLQNGAMTYAYFRANRYVKAYCVFYWFCVASFLSIVLYSVAWTVGVYGIGELIDVYLGALGLYR